MKTRAGGEEFYDFNVTSKHAHALQWNLCLAPSVLLHLESTSISGLTCAIRYSNLHEYGGFSLGHGWGNNPISTLISNLSRTLTKTG